MAHSATHFSLFLLLVALFHPQIEARIGIFYDELPSLSFLSPSPSPMINEISQPPNGFSPSPSPVLEGGMSPEPAPEWDNIEAPMVSELAPTPGVVGAVSDAPVVSEIAPTPVETIDNAYGLYGSSDFSTQVFNQGTPDKVTNNVAYDVDDNEGFNRKTNERASNNVVVDDERENDVFRSKDFDTQRFKEVNNYNQNGYKNLPSNTNQVNNGGGEDVFPSNDFNTESFKDVNNDNQNDGYKNLPSNANHFNNGGGEDVFPSNDFNTESSKEVNNYNQNDGYKNLPSNTNQFNNGGGDDVFPSNDFNTESFKEVNNYNQNDGYKNLPSNTNYFNNGGFTENNNDNNNGVNYNAVPVSNYNDRRFDNNPNEDRPFGRDGVSDTRFMENGKYSYDNQNGNKNQNYGYESVNREGNNAGRYYGDRTKYEFDSMDEFEKEQGYPENQKYYVP